MKTNPPSCVKYDVKALYDYQLLNTNNNKRKKLNPRLVALDKSLFAKRAPIKKGETQKTSAQKYIIYTNTTNSLNYLVLY